MTLWSAREAATATGGEARGDWTASGVSIDSRSIAPGDLFVALKAARDGHDFVAAALEAGAAAALVSRVPEGVDADAPLLVVDDVQSGLEALGRAARDRTNARVVAVTGSVGKTSTKEMLKAVLERQGSTHAAVASYNNHWGVPLTLARMPQDTEYAVIEIGMNRPGEIAPLARQARPHVALVTTVAEAHLEALGSLEAIAREKASIFEGLEPGGVAVFNADLPTTPILARAAADFADAAIGFGAKAGEWRLGSVRLAADSTVAEASAANQPILFKLRTAGRHFAMNGLATLACADALGADLTLACHDLARWEPPAGRGARLRILLDPIEPDLAFELIDDAYNANPSSMRAGLEVLAAAIPRDGVGRVHKGRRIAILGDMLELGVDELALHAALSGDPSLAGVTTVHCVGPRMRALHDALPVEKRGLWHEASDAMASEVHRLVDAGDVVMVKGSLGAKVGRVVDALRKLGHADPQSEEKAG